MPYLESYKTALSLFELLGSEPYVIAKTCRLEKGGFIFIDKEILKVINADLNMGTITELLEKPVMR